VAERRLAGAEEIVYSAKARANPERPAEYRVDVEMTWSSQGVRREKRFTTILLREIPFGERLRRRFVEHAQTPPAAERAAGQPAETPGGKPAPGGAR
jgi:hypothetical protein